MEQNFDSPAPIVAEEKKTCSCEGGCKCKKGKKGLIVTTVIMAILAVAGCGFGVYGMIKANEKSEDDNSKASSTENNGSGITKKNPIITAGLDSDSMFTITDSFVLLTDDGERVNLELSVSDGEIIGCELSEEDSNDSRACKITGLTGKISKVERTAHGHDAGGDIIAFVLEDGTVDFFPTDIEKLENQIKITGKLNIDGFVTDIVKIGVGCNTKKKDPCGGYADTLFVLDDGSFVHYGKDILPEELKNYL